MAAIKKARQQFDDDESFSEEAGVIGTTEVTRQIEELAYYKAEARGFEGGHELDDWIEAERELLGSA